MVPVWYRDIVVPAFSEFGFANFELNICLDFETVQHGPDPHSMYEFILVDSSYQHHGFSLQVWSKYFDHSAGFCSV
jgi:hypothetical protein